MGEALENANNVLDFTAGVVPVTLVSEADLATAYEPRTDDQALAEAARRAVAGSLGLPVLPTVPVAFLKVLGGGQPGLRSEV